VPTKPEGAGDPAAVWPSLAEETGTYAINITAGSGATEVVDLSVAADVVGNVDSAKYILGFRISNTGGSVGSVTIDIDGRLDASTTPGQVGGGSTMYTILASYTPNDIEIPGNGIPFGGYLKITTVASSFAVTIFYSVGDFVRAS